MSNFVEWIGAEADSDRKKNVAPVVVRSVVESERNTAWLAPHKFPVHTRDGAQAGIHAERNWQSDPDIWLYRGKTTALLRRYMRWSLEAGRVPSLLGRELFRAKISSYRATTFEARVIFLHDIERCLGRLQEFDRQIVARVVLQEYDHEAAAKLLQCTRKTLERRLPELIDEVSESLLKSDLLERIPDTRKNNNE
jgi:hypothetical protein